MQAKLIVNAVVLVGAISCIVASGFLLFAMVGEINRLLPQDQRISYLWGHWQKYSEIYAEYKRVCPTGRLLLYYKLLALSGFGLLLVFAWLIGMFGR